VEDIEVKRKAADGENTVGNGSDVNVIQQLTGKKAIEKNARRAICGVCWAAATGGMIDDFLEAIVIVSMTDKLKAV
jgi:hypothetical protein